MANELKITENRLSFQRGELVLRNHEICIGQTLSPVASQANSLAFNAQTQSITVYTDIACYIRIWDGAGTLTASNGEYLPEGVARDYEVKSGQILSCIVI